METSAAAIAKAAPCQWSTISRHYLNPLYEPSVSAMRELFFETERLYRLYGIISGYRKGI